MKGKIFNATRGAKVIVKCKCCKSEFEAPEPETKKMVENFLIDDLNQSKINYYTQNGWQLVSILESDILVKKDFEKYLTRKEIAIIRQKATLYYEDYSRNKGDLFWEDVRKEAEAEYLSEYGSLPSQSEQEDDEIPF